MITRNEIFNWFKKEWHCLDVGFIALMFKGLSDEQLAKSYNLKVLRKGYFIN
jgi:hypothetical protein